MLVSRLVYILGLVFGGSGLFIFQLPLAPQFLEPALLHNLLYASLHHAEVLLGVDVLGLGLVLHVIHLVDVSLLLLVALKAVVDAGGGPWGLVQQALQLEGVRVGGLGVLRQHGNGVGSLVEREVLPAVGAEAREVESMGKVEVSH
jgi:hypothetical protein